MEILRASVLRVFDFEFDILRSLGMIFIKRDLTNSKYENLPILKIVLHKISIVERMTSPPPPASLIPVAWSYSWRNYKGSNIQWGQKTSTGNSVYFKIDLLLLTTNHNKGQKQENNARNIVLLTKMKYILIVIYHKKTEIRY